MASSIEHVAVDLGIEVMKKVALLTSTFFPAIGGVEVGIHNIALRLLERSITPVVIAPYSSKTYEHLKDLPYEVHLLPPKILQLFNLLPFRIATALYSKYYGYLQKKYDFDFWHITMGYPTGVSFIRFGNERKIPYLIRCAGWDIQVSDDGDYGARRDAKIDAIISQNLKNSAALVAISQSVVEDYRNLGVDEEIIIHINNGVDTGLFAEGNAQISEVCSRYGIPTDHKVFLTVGRNHPKKNYLLLPKIALALTERGLENFTFVVVGGGVTELEQEIPEQFKRNFVLLESFGVDFTGGSPTVPHPDLVDLYLSADVFVFPTFIETFGIVLVEAMAAKLPIVASEVEGCRDLVEQGKNGFLEHPEDHEAFAQKILRLLESETEYETMSQNNAVKARQYDWDLVVDKYIEAYDDQIQGLT